MLVRKILSRRRGLSSTQGSAPAVVPYRLSNDRCLLFALEFALDLESAAELMRSFENELGQFDEGSCCFIFAEGFRENLGLPSMRLGRLASVLD